MINSVNVPNTTSTVACPFCGTGCTIRQVNAYTKISEACEHAEKLDIQVFSTGYMVFVRFDSTRDYPIEQHYDRWFILIGNPGFNLPANNGKGYATKAAAVRAHKKCMGA